MVHNHDHAGVKGGGGGETLFTPPSCATKKYNQFKKKIGWQNWSISSKYIRKRVAREKR